MTHPSGQPVPPFRRLVEVANVGADGATLTIEATEAERRALASANRLVELRALSAELRLVREGRTGIGITGDVKAAIRQTCVATLEDFDSLLEEPIDVHFLPERELDALREHRSERQHPGSASPSGSASPGGSAAGLAASTNRGDGDDEPDLPDPIINGRIDIGTLAAEFLTLGLDPYPRKPGASFSEPADTAATVSPFAALARLKDMKDT